MPHFVTGTVARIIEERKGLQKIEVEGGDRAYVLTELIGDVNPGDNVILNVTAVDLKLGTGGWHFVHWNLSRDEWKNPGPGHVMKLRYTSLQCDVGSLEEYGNVDEATSLNGIPVIGCLLLSQVAPLAAAYKAINPDGRLILVVADQNALPLALSDLVHELASKTLIDGTITAGQAFGGDYEAVTVMSALGIAASHLNADAIVVANGHGSVGTGTKHGFSSISIASALDDAANFGGKPVLALRWSDADQRDRHRGLSHHTQTVLERTGPLTMPVPQNSDLDSDRHHVLKVDVPDVAKLLASFELTVTTMGRGIDQDPGFFDYAAAAGVFAASISPKDLT